MENQTEMNTSRMFYYNKINYHLKLKPELSKYFTPKKMLIFSIVLPYWIPFSEKTSITYFDRKKQSIYHLHFSSIQHDEIIYTGAYRENGHTISNQKSRVEMVYTKKGDINITEENQSEIFDSLIITLNKVISSIIIKTKNLNIFKITKETLDPIVVYKFVNVKDYTFESGLFTLHSNKIDIDTIRYTEAKSSEIVSFIDSYNLNPFSYSTELYYEAKRFFKYGDYKTSIISAQTSIEVFFTNLYKYLLSKENVDEFLIEKKITDIAFKNMVIHQFQKRIGGDFTLDNYSPTLEWWNSTYLLRNKVVHSGYEPTYKESEKSIKAVEELYFYISNLIHSDSNEKKYPELLEYIILPKL